MRIEIYHASKYGNGAEVAEELRRLLESRGHQARAQHFKDASPGSLPSADLYVFGSPGRIGKPIGGMRRFLKKAKLPAGTRYALFSTEAMPRPDKNGRMPTEEEIAQWQRIQPLMDEILVSKELRKVADAKIYVKDLKGPLEDGWQRKVEQFADALVADQ
jgi:menaquinone-dependent protoporphyrinogen IX oxidase